MLSYTSYPLIHLTHLQGLFCIYEVAHHNKEVAEIHEKARALSLKIVGDEVRDLVIT